MGGHVPLLPTLMTQLHAGLRVYTSEFIATYRGSTDE
jgi:hypothetical protein